MGINPKTGEVDLLLRVSGTDLACRNALHRAMKHGIDVALGYETEEDEVYEAGAPVILALDDRSGC